MSDAHDKIAELRDKFLHADTPLVNYVSGEGARAAGFEYGRNELRNAFPVVKELLEKAAEQGAPATEYHLHRLMQVVVEGLQKQEITKTDTPEKIYKFVAEKLAEPGGERLFDVAFGTSQLVRAANAGLDKPATLIPIADILERASAREAEALERKLDMKADLKAAPNHALIWDKTSGHPEFTFDLGRAAESHAAEAVRPAAEIAKAAEGGTASRTAEAAEEVAEKMSGKKKWLIGGGIAAAVVALGAFMLSGSKKSQSIQDEQRSQRGNAL